MRQVLNTTLMWFLNSDSSLAFGNEKFTNTENTELLTHSSLKIKKEGPHN